MQPVPLQESARLSRLREYLTRDPSNLNLLSEVADLSLGLGHLADARAAIAQALAVSPADRYFRSRLSSVAIAEQNWSEAIELCRGLLAEGEDHPAIRYNLGRALLYAGEYQDARAELAPLLAVEGLPADLPQLLIRALHHCGEVAEAAKVAQQYLEKHPDDAEVAGMLSLLQIDLGDLAAAKQWSDKALARLPDNLDALLAAGTSLLAAEDHAAATATFDHALRVSPANGRAWAGRALARLLELDVPGARADFEQATRFMSGHLGSWVGLGWIQFLDGDVDAATASFNEALARDRNFAENYAGLAIVAIAKGDWAEADKQIELALRLNPRSPGGQMARTLLLRCQNRPEVAQVLFQRGLGSLPVPGGGTVADMIVRVLTHNAGRRPAA